MDAEPDLDPAIEPDTKNWTWVLERPCPDCGFEAESLDVVATGALIRRIAAAWEAALATPGVTQRPAPLVWSTLEYACHVRDVFEVFDGRLTRMVTEDDPHFENWDQDQTAVERKYGEQDPAAVAGDLVANAARLADRFDAVRPSEWSRTGTRSDGAHFSIGSFARYLVHDPIHHLWDIGAPLA